MTEFWFALAATWVGVLVVWFGASYLAVRREEKDIDAIRREVFEDKRMAAEVREAFSEYDFAAWEQEVSS